MNAIERLRDRIAERFPDLTTEIDPPGDPAGGWFLDVRRAGAIPPVVIEWRPDRGFGLSTPTDDDFGTKPDEVYRDEQEAFGRVVRLVLSGGPTSPPEAVRLAELWHSRRLTQGELAERAGVKQANISRTEGRDDVLVSTLAKVVAAMGGELSICATFPDGTRRELSLRGMAEC